MKRFIEDAQNTSPPFDILFNHLSNALRILNESYSELIIQKKKKPYQKPFDTKTWHIENTINEDLVLIAEKKSKQEGLLLEWINENKNLDTKNRIDIAIIYELGLGNEKRLGIECKHLIKNTKNALYINNGVDRFATGYYSSEMPIGGMLGYIEEGNIKTITEDIRKKLKPIKFEKTTLPCKLNNIYLTNHDRKKFLIKKPNMERNFKLYHMMLDFNSVIDRN